MAGASRRGYIDIRAPKQAPKAPPRSGVTVMPQRVREEATQQPVAVIPPEVLAPPQPPAPVLTVKNPVEAPVVVPANSTPFVNADKVEKRPLGAYSDVSVQTPELEDPTVPPQLRPDMLAIQSA